MKKRTHKPSSHYRLRDIRKEKPGFLEPVFVQLDSIWFAVMTYHNGNWYWLNTKRKLSKHRQQPLYWAYIPTPKPKKRQ